MKYISSKRRRRWPRHLVIGFGVFVAVLVGGTIAVRHIYFNKLGPVDSRNEQSQLITIEPGSSADAIALQLEKAGLIRSAWAFKLYVGSKNVRGDLQAGTYSFDPSQGVPEIVALLTHGKVQTDLVTIIPGLRLSEVREVLLKNGFSETDVDRALQANTYANNPALVDKPANASLEGYIFPDSFQRTASTSAQTIIEQSLGEMHKRLTPDLRAAFASQGLSTYQAIVLASIVEQEVGNQSDREQVAQVFLRRLRERIPLGADPTAYYGSALAGVSSSVHFDSPYNTRLHIGLPPTPISNVSESSLRAVAFPAKTDWLYFVAGDDGVTHFTHTFAEHQAATDLYCKELCRATSN